MLENECYWISTFWISKVYQQLKPTNINEKYPSQRRPHELMIISIMVPSDIPSIVFLSLIFDKALFDNV